MTLSWTDLLLITTALLFGTTLRDWAAKWLGRKSLTTYWLRWFR